MEKEIVLSEEECARIDAAWAEEAEARIDAYDRGELKSISLEESRKRINAMRNTES